MGGRNYFTRASADEFEGEEEAAEQDTLEESEERAAILEEAAMLKQYAEFYLHPEKPVETTDAYACGRNYFTRASADGVEGEEEAAEREQILQECAELKKYAGFHLHPEQPVVSQGSTLAGRCYFDRASAPEQDTLEESEERAAILEEAAMLKQYAEFYLHPEKPVETTDAFACGRNYFTRFSAVRDEPIEQSQDIQKPSKRVTSRSNTKVPGTKLLQAPNKHASDAGNNEEEGMTR